jgi:hypothetical protein
MTVMSNRSLSWIVVALGLGAFHADRAAGQRPASAPLPAGVTACEFTALARPAEPDGPTVRETPGNDGRVLGRLPAAHSPATDLYGPDGELPEVRVIGVKDGWLLIEGATYQQPSLRPKIYDGRGWIEGKSLTTHLFRDTLRSAPGNGAPDAAYLRRIADGNGYRPYDVEVQAVVGCAGRWLEVEIHLPGARTVSGKPVAATDGTVRGWTDRSCAQQQNTPCWRTQFDYPWSPLPAGVTECDFGALSRDPDPAGLNVRAAPDGTAPVLGRLAPPSDIGGGTTVLAEVRVIGFQKGWFLIEAGPYPDSDLPSGKPRPYSGRGWVSGAMLTTGGLLRNMLKQAPSEKAADVVDLEVGGGAVSNAQSANVRRILACSGDWALVEVALVKGMKPLLKTDAPAGAVRGWANGICIQQLTTCDFTLTTPWSPPAPLPPQ